MTTINEQIRNVVRLLAKPANENQTTDKKQGILIFEKITMATIKSYTDIEQSKKLAEILPIESADMEYLRLKEANALIGSVPFVKDESEVEDSAYNAVYERIPCWSLSALLDIIPEVSLNTFKDKKWNAMIQNDGKMIYEDKDNPIDACYELILKLHELKML